MNKIEEIKECYAEAKQITEGSADKINALFLLESKLLSDSSNEMLDFNYKCLREQADHYLYLYCRAAFVKRTEDIDSYLLNKIQGESDIHIIGDVIHILGRRRSQLALPLSIKYLEMKDEYIREVCLYVIGWVGNVEHIDVLKKHLTNEDREKLKITAGSALRQIYWKLPETKDTILKVLGEAFFQEHDDHMKARIIELLSTIAVKNLGIREDKNDPEILLGDINKAIVKAERFLAKIGMCAE